MYRLVDDADVRRFRHRRGHQLAIQRNRRWYRPRLHSTMPGAGLDSDDPMSLGEVGIVAVGLLTWRTSTQE